MPRSKLSPEERRERAKESRRKWREAHSPKYGQGKGHSFIDLTGRRFDRLVVVSRAEDRERGKPRWNCVCDCGNVRTVNGEALRGGATRSCGCFWQEQNAKRIARLPLDPKSNRPAYFLWQNAKHRAKRDGLPFDIKPEDIVIPTHCLVLGTELRFGSKKPTDNSPTLDKVIPALGYVRGNIQVISFRANSIKRDATAKELQLVLQYVESHTPALLRAA